ncbi:hypothetical protein MUP79_00210 [Candidatus Bathyarchaeota archaeon]|nr:hypothetical protein [Candidatus Bathyarchaeota archaeon]
MHFDEAEKFWQEVPKEKIVGSLGGKRHFTDYEEAKKYAKKHNLELRVDIFQGYNVVPKKEKIIGGLGDNRPDSDFPKAELKKGIKVEMEHTKDPKVAKEIAKDHLSESSIYYKELAKMEKNLKKENKPSKNFLLGFHPAIRKGNWAKISERSASQFFSVRDYGLDIYSPDGKNWKVQLNKAGMGIRTLYFGVNPTDAKIKAEVYMQQHPKGE